MIRFALIVASTLGFVLTAALGNFMAPLLQELERFRPQEQQEPQTPVQSRVPALGGLCLMVSTLAAVGVGWTAACIAQPTLLGSESQLMTRLLIALFGAQAFGAIGLADDAARLRSRAQLGLRRLPRLALEAAAAAAVLVLLAVNGCLPTGLQLPGAGYVELGGAAPVLWGLVLVALAECARTADGADGTVWGGEFLLADTRSYRRLGHIDTFAQAGGDLAAREGWRVAVALLLDACEKPDEARELALTARICSGAEFDLVASMIEHGINAVTSSSAGRVFDAASAALGLRRRSTCEGEAAMVLEFAAERFAARGETPVSHLSPLRLVRDADGGFAVPVAGLVAELARAQAAGRGAGA